MENSFVFNFVDPKLTVGKELWPFSLKAIYSVGEHMPDMCVLYGFKIKSLAPQNNKTKTIQHSEYFTLPLQHPW